jgi:hypothetical protein
MKIIKKELIINIIKLIIIKKKKTIIIIQNFQNMKISHLVL